ncbi:MAG: response regulator transcription factor [Flavobacteriaceae bacterium]|nr:response regulator transcription factor [Flavobacteriaceae bacterium]
MKIKIAITDDNPLLISAVKAKLSFFDELDVKFIAYNGRDLLDKLVEDSSIDLILMDLEMPIMDGVEATRSVKQLYPDMKIVILTVFDNDENIFNAIKAGADGYLLKEINANDLFNGIKETLSGGAAMNPSIAMKTLKLLRNPQGLENKKDVEEIQLSIRETDVLEQLSKGIKYNQIADNLFISPGTVRKHIENIYKKLQVHNKLEAVTKARRNKLIN